MLDQILLVPLHRVEDQLRQRVGAGDLDLVSLERVDGLQEHRLRPAYVLGLFGCDVDRPQDVRECALGERLGSREVESSDDLSGQIPSEIDNALQPAHPPPSSPRRATTARPAWGVASPRRNMGTGTWLKRSRRRGEASMRENSWCVEIMSGSSHNESQDRV